MMMAPWHGREAPIAIDRRARRVDPIDDIDDYGNAEVTWNSNDRFAVRVSGCGLAETPTKGRDGCRKTGKCEKGAEP